MCTVSWSISSGGYDLWFNRDELTTRAPEEPPELAQCDGVTFLAPRDGDHGGTWLVTNEFGVTICLLNDYGASWRPSASIRRWSRGHLVLAGAQATDRAALADVIRRQPLDRTSPFYLLALFPEEKSSGWHWNGVRLTRVGRPGAFPMLTSSSYESTKVIAVRTARYAASVQSVLAPKPSELAAFHRQHGRDKGAQSVLMRRPDASTRSVTHVTMRPHHVAMRYEAVCWSARGPEFQKPVLLTLPRRRPPMRRSDGPALTAEAITRMKG